MAVATTDPVGMSTPKFPTRDRVATDKAEGASFPLLCPAQAHPPPRTRYARGFTTRSRLILADLFPLFSFPQSVTVILLRGVELFRNTVALCCCLMASSWMFLAVQLECFSSPLDTWRFVISTTASGKKLSAVFTLSPKPAHRPSEPVGFSAPKFTWEERVNTLLTVLKPAASSVSLFCEAQGYPVPAVR
ncbi:hypothetical protein E2C01_026395 [Portunus trituberculatus]|uniref:Uncharacterized protein n=1 Tax=Portunus trituberculatus TaxID=210409 RepID=A0A5B7EIM9_PORTR|nr:hypothetical protein [Portunus trituberculatus]